MSRDEEQKRASLGQAELELLQFIDRHPAISAGDVATEFGSPRGLARTTILTVMKRLVAKGFLKREQVEGVYRYSTQVSAARAVSGLVSDFVRKVLGGSVSPFVAYLGQKQELSDQEIADLKKLINDLEQKPRKRRRPNSSESGPSGEE